MGEMSLGTRKSLISLEERIKCDEFDNHFAWVPFPAHVTAHCGQCEFGVGEKLLRNNGFKPNRRLCSSCYAPEEQATLAEREWNLRIEAEEYNIASAFLCLNRMKDITINSCRRQLETFLSLELDEGVGEARMDSRDSRDRKGYTLMSRTDSQETT